MCKFKIGDEVVAVNRDDWYTTLTDARFSVTEGMRRLATNQVVMKVYGIHGDEIIVIPSYYSWHESDLELYQTDLENV